MDRDSVVLLAAVDDKSRARDTVGTVAPLAGHS
jgi:hypothetical protein